MRLNTVKHFIGTACRNLFLNRLMTIASVLTVASCIFIVSVFYLLVANVNSVFGQLQDQIGLVALVDDDVPAEDMTYLFYRIMAIPNVRIAVPINPEDNQYIIDSLFGPGSAMAEHLMQDNPFRRAFSIDIHDIQLHDEVVQALEALQPYGIVTVRSEQELADTLWNLTQVVRTISLIVIFILGAISLVIIINTIRITVGTRQAEISIMKYVGATDWFIRWPFIIEGLLIGLAGAIIPAVICIFGYDSVITTISNVPMLDFMYFLPGEQVLFYVVPFAIMVGTFIGLIGSAVSVRQYLKV